MTLRFMQVFRIPKGNVMRQHLKQFAGRNV